MRLGKPFVRSFVAATAIVAGLVAGLAAVAVYSTRRQEAAAARGPVLIRETPEGARVYRVPLDDGTRRHMAVGKDGSVANLTPSW